MSRTCWTNAVTSGAWAAASSSEPTTYRVPPARMNVSGSNPACSGWGRALSARSGSVRQLMASRRVSQIPDRVSSTTCLGLLQGAAHGGQAGMVAEDVSGFGVPVVLAPGHELRNRRMRQVRGEQVGGEDVDGAALEEPMVPRPVGAAAVAAGGGDEGLGATFRRLHRAAVLDRGPPHPPRPVRGAGQVEQVDGGAGAFPGGGGEEEQVELGGGDQQPGRSVEHLVDQVGEGLAGLLRGDHPGRVLQRQPQVLTGDRRPMQRDPDLPQRGAGPATAGQVRPGHPGAASARGRGQLPAHIGPGREPGPGRRGQPVEHPAQPDACRQGRRCRAGW